MRTALSPVKVGILTIIVLVLLGYLIFKTSESPVTRGKGYRVSMLFPNAKGLVKKSQVLVSGIPVGEIENIKLEGTQARVWVRLRPDLKLYENARATKVQESLLGTSLIEIFPGTPDHPRIRDGGEIKHVTDLVTVEEIFNKFAAISDDVKSITAALRSTVATTTKEGGTRPALEEILRNFTEISTSLNHILKQYKDKAGKIVENTNKVTNRAERITKSVEHDFVAIVANLRDITDRLREMIAKNGDMLSKSSESISRISKRAEKVLERLDRIAANLEQITNDLRQGKGTVGKLLTDKKIGDDIEYITSKVKTFTERADKLQLQFHLEANYYPHFDAGKAYVYLNIRPNKKKYYLFGVVSDPWGSVNRSTTDITNEQFDQNGNLVSSSHRREKSVTTEDKLKVTLLYARNLYLHKWFVPTFYFGLIENSGGVGMELHLFEDFWRIETQLYDFQLERHPNWKAQTSITFLEHRFFVTFGLDHILDATFKYWFVGGGIEFTDEDLKLLLTFGAPKISTD